MRRPNIARDLLVKRCRTAMWHSVSTRVRSRVMTRAPWGLQREIELRNSTRLIIWNRIPADSEAV